MRNVGHKNIQHTVRYRQLSLEPYKGLQNSYREAIASYDRVLLLAPNHTYTLNNKEIVLAKLEDLQGG